MGMNKELPREEQLKIILKNYDKVVAERDTLKAENVKLQFERKQLSEELAQSKVVYKNMLARFEGQQDKKTKDHWENKYNELNKKYEKKNERYMDLDRKFRIMQNCMSKVVESVTCAYNNVTSAKSKLAYDIEALTYNDVDKGFVPEVVPDAPLNMPSVDDKEESPAMPKTFSDYQDLNFIKYVRILCKRFKETGTLRGIAQFAKNQHVSALKKEQFFKFGLNNEPLTDEYIISVYKQIKKR